MERERARRLLRTALVEAELLAAAERRWLVGGDDGSDVHPVDQHQADAATDLCQHESDVAVLRSEEYRVREIVDALARVRAGTYGWCESCGEALADDRLVAVPATRWCVQHELEQELAAIGRPDPPSPLVVLPGDDDLADDIDLAPEELALHIESASRSLTAEALERYEAAGE